MTVAETAHDQSKARTGGRRELTIVVLATVAAAGLVLFAVSRTWVVEAVGDQPMVMVADRTGAVLTPALPALAIVALAGAGALVASRGWARAAVSVLLLLSGIGIAVLAGAHLADHDGRRAIWPALVLAGGGIVALMGLRALLCGQSYPSMGTRYERAAREPVEGDLWAAIDRGEDPTRD
jgi:hypothetical protein